MHVIEEYNTAIMKISIINKLCICLLLFTTISCSMQQMKVSESHKICDKIVRLELFKEDYYKRTKIELSALTLKKLQEVFTEIIRSEDFLYRYHLPSSILNQPHVTYYPDNPNEELTFEDIYDRKYDYYFIINCNNLQLYVFEFTLINPFSVVSYSVNDKYTKKQFVTEDGLERAMGKIHSLEHCFSEAERKSILDIYAACWEKYSE